MFGIEILGMGSYTPSICVTNEDMAKIVETNDEWITTRTGISSRNFTDGEPTWKMGVEAAKKAIEAAGISPEEIGLIIDATITNDFSTPSTACVIQGKIGAVNAAAFDLSAACSGFVYSVDVAKRFLQTDDNLKYVLVIANENLSRILDYTDRSSCILFGDGAAAAVIGKSDKLYSSHLGADGTGAHFLYAKHPDVKHPFRTKPSEMAEGEFGSDKDVLAQDGKEVYKFATKALPLAASKAIEKAGIDISTIDWFVPHQANIRIIETAAKNLGVSMDKFIVNISTHGNTSGVSIPLALSEAIESGKIKKGDRICLVGFGAGLTLGAIIMDY